MKDTVINSNDWINYELQSSNSKNYDLTQHTSSPESFPVLMENGIIIQYELVQFSTEIVENNKDEEPIPNIGCLSRLLGL